MLGEGVKGIALEAEEGATVVGIMVVITLRVGTGVGGTVGALGIGVTTISLLYVGAIVPSTGDGVPSDCGATAGAGVTLSDESDTPTGPVSSSVVVSGVKEVVSSSAVSSDVEMVVTGPVHQGRGRGQGLAANAQAPTGLGNGKLRVTSYPRKPLGVAASSSGLRQSHWWAGVRLQGGRRERHLKPVSPAPNPPPSPHPSPSPSTLCYSRRGLMSCSTSGSRLIVLVRLMLWTPTRDSSSYRNVADMESTTARPGKTSVSGANVSCINLGGARRLGGKALLDPVGPGSEPTETRPPTRHREASRDGPTSLEAPG